MRPQLVRIVGIGIAILLAAGVISCRKTGNGTLNKEMDLPPKPEPRGYVCYRTGVVITVDGKLGEPGWITAPWTEYFVDIEGQGKPVPRFNTRAKMLWDSANLYIAAELEEPHLWARLKRRDTVIFYDPDFEVFIDPDGDTHGYYELEVNALGTAWDLLLPKPYRDGGPAIDSWDVQGLQVGISLQGTLNDPTDIDQGWTVEIGLPWEVLNEYAGDAKSPGPGDQWRINFSRVEWRTLINGESYTKEINPATGKPYPEDNWVWSPQGRINIHMPEMWGYVQFSQLVSGTDREMFIPDPDLDTKWALRMIYYRQISYQSQYQTFAKKIKALGLTPEDFPSSSAFPQLQATDRTFEAWIPQAGSSTPWSIRENGKLLRRQSGGK